MNTEAIQVITTVEGRTDADKIAAELVSKGLAACVQISGPIESTYLWKDQVETSQEWLCTVKTLKQRYGEVEEAIRQIHPYDEPEILATPVVAGSEGYLKWLTDLVTPS